MGAAIPAECRAFPVHGREQPGLLAPVVRRCGAPASAVCLHSRPGWSIRARSSVVTVRAEISAMTHVVAFARACSGVRPSNLLMLKELPGGLTRYPPTAQVGVSR